MATDWGLMLRGLMAGMTGAKQGKIMAQQEGYQQQQQAFMNEMRMQDLALAEARFEQQKNYDKVQEALVKARTLSEEFQLTQARKAAEQPPPAPTPMQDIYLAAGGQPLPPVPTGETVPFETMRTTFEPSPDIQALALGPQPAPTMEGLALGPQVPAGLETMFGQPAAPVEPAFTTVDELVTREAPVMMEPGLPAPGRPSMEAFFGLPAEQRAGFEMDVDKEGKVTWSWKGAPEEAPSVVEAREMKTAIEEFKAFGVPEGMEGSPLWVAQETAFVDYLKADADASVAMDKAERSPDKLDNEDTQRLWTLLVTQQRSAILSEQILREEFARKKLDPARLAQLAALTAAIAKNFDIKLARLSIAMGQGDEAMTLSITNWLGMIDDVARGDRTAESVAGAVKAAAGRGELPSAIAKIVAEGAEDAAAATVGADAWWRGTGPYGAVEPRPTE